MSNLVPDGWSLQLIGEVFDIAIGGTPSRNNSAYWDIGKVTNNRWLSIRDLRGRTIKDTSEYLSDEGVAKSNAKLVPKGTVIMSFKLTVGRTAFTGIDLYTNEAIVAFFPKKNVQVNLNYFYQGLQFWDLLENIDQAVKGVTLNKEKINLINGLFPPLSEQQKIAKILTSVDEVIEKTQAQIDKLKDLKTGMMQELLTNGIGHAEFKDSPVGRIPAEWEVVKFKEIFSDYKYGPRFSSKDYHEQGNVKTIRGTDLSRIGEISYQNVPIAKLDEDVVNLHALRDGDLVMITTADCGATAIFREQSIPFIASAYAIKLTPKDNVDSHFVTHFMQTSSAKKQVESFIRKGTVANLPGSDVMSITLALPPIKEQQYITEVLNHLDKKISLKQNKLVSIVNTKKALMQDLLTGKVRVKVDSE